MLNVILIRKASLTLALAACATAGSVWAQAPMEPAGNGSSSLPLAASQGRSSNGSNGPLTAIPEDFSDLRLAPGFLLDVQVYDDPQLSTQTRVDKDGNLTIPLVGPVHVAGQTIAEAQKAIEDKLKSGEILNNPQVTLNVQQYASANVTVLGEVQNPGRLQLLAPHSLLDVIGMAGGETNLAGDVIEVKHPAESGQTTASYHYSRNTDGSSIHDVMVQPGDTVVVKRAGIVYVMGAVNRPGGYVMQEDGKLDVAQALSMAAGTSMQARVGGLVVVRRNAEGQLQEIPLSYKKITSGKEKPLELQAQDIVYVPVSKIKAALSQGSTIVGQTASATIYAVR